LNLPKTHALEADEYFSGKAEQKRMDLSELLTAILKREIEIDEALK
jgi:hypothetical protein